MVVRWVRQFCALFAVLLVSTVPDGYSSGAKAAEPVLVKVGAYEYGVVYYFENGTPNGMVPTLIGLLNSIQNEYQFDLVETSSRRRYLDLQEGNIDLVLLENPLWGWQDYDVKFSDKLVSTEDIYIRRRDKPTRGDPFADIYLQSIICVLGFHYGFAEFNADPAYLKEFYDVELAYNETEVLNGIVRGDAQIGIVSAGFFARQLSVKPELGDSIDIGPEPDAIHDLVSVISGKSSISVVDFNRLIEKLQADGTLQRAWQKLYQGLSG